MNTTKSEMEANQRQLVGLQKKGLTEGAQESFFRGDKEINHNCDRCISYEKLVIQEGCQWVDLIISIC